MIRLLIADDEKLEREALAELVQRRFEREVVLEMAENGRKAADTAVLWGADLILMDIEMPGMSGLDAARAVLAQRPSCRVIFVTAYSLFQYAHEAVHLGACNIYHACCHNYLHEREPEILKACCKSAFFVLQARYYLETGAYISRKADLLDRLAGADRAVLESLLSGAFAERFTECSGLLLDWASGLIRQ